MIPNPKPDWWPATAEVADATVNVSGLNPTMIDFLAGAAAYHAGAYGKPLVVTSADDGIHASGSKHYKRMAVDIRSRELSMEEQRDFAHWLSDAQEQYGLGVFDERFIGAPHWHVEVA